jgi:hypothetical protein
MAGQSFSNAEELLSTIGEILDTIEKSILFQFFESKWKGCPDVPTATPSTQSNVPEISKQHSV